MGGIGSAQSMLDIQEQQRLQQLLMKGGTKGARKKTATVKMQRLSGKQALPNMDKMNQILQQTGLDKTSKLDLQKLQTQDVTKLIGLLQQAGIPEEKMALLIKLDRSKGKKGKSALEELLEELEKKKYPFSDFKDEDLANWAERWLSQNKDESSPKDQDTSENTSEENESNAPLLFESPIQKLFYPNWSLSDATSPNTSSASDIFSLFEQLDDQIERSQHVLQKIFDSYLRLQHPKKLKTPLKQISTSQVRYAIARLDKSIGALSDWILSKKNGDKFLNNLKKLQAQTMILTDMAPIQDAVALLTELMIMGRDLVKKSPKKTDS